MLELKDRLQLYFTSFLEAALLVSRRPERLGSSLPLGGGGVVRGPVVKGFDSGSESAGRVPTPLPHVGVMVPPGPDWSCPRP